MIFELGGRMDKKPQHEAKLIVKFAVSYIHFLQALANPQN
jgi:hypothetical protein